MNGALQAEKAVKIAAHSPIIEFGLLAILLAFVQQDVFLSERWTRRWVIIMLSGSVVLPVFVAASFTDGAKSDLIAARASFQTYSETQFDYVRSVDVHSH